MIRIRPLLSSVIAAAVLVAPPASAAVHNLVFGPVFATAAATQGTPTTTAQFTGAGSWYKTYPGAKFEVYFDVPVLLGTSFTVDQIASITYHTVNNATNTADVDFFLALYSDPFLGGDAPWYGRRLNAEPLIRAGHGAYLTRSLGVGQGEEYPGVDGFTTHWHNRNLRIFANIQRITDGPGDRILVIIGAGHLPILRHTVQCAPGYHLVEVSEFLD